MSRKFHHHLKQLCRVEVTWPVTVPQREQPEYENPTFMVAVAPDSSQPQEWHRPDTWLEAEQGMGQAAPRTLDFLPCCHAAARG